MSAPPESSVIDWSQLDAIADGWNEEFLEIYEEFLLDLPKDLDQAEQFISLGSAEDVAKMAHRVKGCAANFGFEGVRRPAFALEQAAKSNDLSLAMQLSQEMRSAFTAGKAEVEVRILDL